MPCLSKGLFALKYIKTHTHVAKISACCKTHLVSTLAHAKNHLFCRSLRRAKQWLKINKTAMSNKVLALNSVSNSEKAILTYWKIKGCLWPKTRIHRCKTIRHVPH